MGDEIEIRDVNGVLVRVPLYPTLSAIGAKLTPGQTMCAPTSDPVWGVEAKLVRSIGIRSEGKLAEPGDDGGIDGDCG